MLIYTLLIFMLHHRKLFILTSFRLTLYRPTLFHRKLFILMSFFFTLHRLMLFHRKPFILTPFRPTLHHLMLHHRKLLILITFRLTPLRRQLLRPFSSYPAPQHRNQFSIAFPNPRKTNLFHSQIIQFLRPVPLS